MLLKHRNEIAFVYATGIYSCFFFERFTFEKVENNHKGSDEESDRF